MSFIVSCPRCAAKLKSAQPVPAGRAVRCPKCQHTFTQVEAVATESPVPLPPAAPTPPPLRSRPASADPIPTAVLLDDDRDFDRRRATRRRPRDDDEDDPPTVRRRRNEDTYDDPPPRRRPAGRAKKRNPALLILIGAALGLVLLLLVGGAVLLIVDPFHWRGGAPGEMLAWAPADTGAVSYMDLDELRKYEKVRNPAPPATTRLGLAADDVSAALTCGRLFGGLDGEVTVLKLRSAPNQDQIVRTVGGTPATANGKSYYTTRDGGAVHFPGGRLVVVARNANTMNALLQKPAGQVVVSDELRAVADRADGQFWMAAATRGGVGPFAMPVPGFGGVPGSSSSFLMCFRLSGNTVEMRMEMTYPDAATAQQMERQLQAFGPALNRQPNTTQTVTTRGNTVIVTTSAPIDSDRQMVFPFR